MPESVPLELPNDMSAQQKKQAQQQQQMQQQIQDILSRVLTREAAERLNNVKLVKPEKAQMIEQYIAQMASKRPTMLGEQDILNLLDQPEFKETTRVIIQRKEDSDDEWAALEGDEY
eukprot:NODE_283_length_10814_cov_0.705460.p13 type:complete len:117 gc:universal NODE_283_length_10814_cov_0.705460:2281-2631(+)